MFWVVFVFEEGLDVIGVNKLEREVGKDLEAAFGGSASPGNGKDHGCEFGGDLFFAYFLAYKFQVIVGFLEFKVFIWAIGVEKGGADSHLHDILA